MSGGGELSEILFFNMKLDELESKLSAGSTSKESVVGAINEAQESILPMRLKFNDFLQMMASIDKMEEVPPGEKFLIIKGKLLELTSSMQQISEEFIKLQPLFDTVPEYSERYGNKHYLPLETLRSVTNGNGDLGLSNNPQLPQSQQSLMESQPQQQQQQPTGSSASSINSVPSRRQSKSNAGTPGSNINTPSGGVTASYDTPSSKKPRKTRQLKRTPSALNMGVGMGSVPTPVMASSSFKPHNGQSPSIGSSNVMNFSNGNSNRGNSVHTVNSVPPTNVANTPLNNVVSPVGNPQTGFGLSQSHPPQSLPRHLSQHLSQQLTQQRQQQVQQRHQQVQAQAAQAQAAQAQAAQAQAAQAQAAQAQAAQVQAQAQAAQAQAQAQAAQAQAQVRQQSQQQYGMGSRSGQLPQAQINLNTITPANILSMNMAPDNQQNLGNRSGKDFDPLDINNLDFGNLNMDFI